MRFIAAHSVPIFKSVAVTGEERIITGSSYLCDPSSGSQWFFGQKGLFFCGLVAAFA